MCRDTQPQIASTARQMDLWSRWIDDCLVTQQQTLIRRADDHQIELDSSGLKELPSVVTAELLRRVWRQVGWPEQSMTAIHWEKLARFCRGDSSEQTRSEDFPGRIYADRSDGQLWLIRKVDASRDG